MRLRTSFVFCMFLGLAMATACGDDGGGDGDGTDNAGTDGGNGNGDGGGITDDGGSIVGGECQAEEAECNNCVDDDEDGLIDGSDPHCAGPEDNDEASFATDIPGDNQDPKSQDCFFDGNSGKDNPCNQIPTCCLLGPGGGGPSDICPSGADPGDETFGRYPGEAECMTLFQCYADNADNITCPAPVGCDCFSCCTVCNPDTNVCEPIYIGPGSPAECDPEDIGEPTMSDCLSCEKSDECGGGECDDDPTDCILCPGQTEDDLPPECNDMNECPGGQTACETSGDCGDGQYCSVGCCLNNVD